MRTIYQGYLDRMRQEYGSQFNPSDLDLRFAPYFRTGQRIKVVTCGMTLTGCVGITTGWKPVFLLIRTRRSHGSPWTLGKRDTLVAAQHGRIYKRV